MHRDRDTIGVQREETWEGCPLTIRLRVWGAGLGAEPARPKVDFMHISCQKSAIWDTLFSIFERWRASQTSRGPGKLFPFSPSPRACFHAVVLLLLFITDRTTSGSDPTCSYCARNLTLCNSVRQMAALYRTLSVHNYRISEC